MLSKEPLNRGSRLSKHFTINDHSVSWARMNLFCLNSDDWRVCKLENSILLSTYKRSYIALFGKMLLGQGPLPHCPLNIERLQHLLSLLLVCLSSCSYGMSGEHPGVILHSKDKYFKKLAKDSLGYKSPSWTK